MRFTCWLAGGGWRGEEDGGWHRQLKKRQLKCGPAIGDLCAPRAIPPEWPKRKGMNQLGDDLGARTVSRSRQGHQGRRRVVVMKIAKSAQGFGLAPSRRKLREINGSFFTPAPRPPTHSLACLLGALHYFVPHSDVYVLYGRA